MDNRFFPLPFRFDIGRLEADLAICEAEQWKNHFNTNDYEGDWTGIALRSGTGKAQDLNTLGSDSGFSDTDLLQRCSYFKEILGQFQCALETVRLLALAPGSHIKTHRDRGLGYPHGCFRIHIPITTDDRVQFIVDGEALRMEVGSCWYANFDLPHSVLHEGVNRRIHLVIDGLRNEWTDELFRGAGYDFTKDKVATVILSEETKRQMISNLEAMNTDAARQIIASLLSGDADLR